MFQFSLRSLLIAMTAVAFVVWVLFAPPPWVGLIVLGLVYATLPAVTLAGVIYHTGYWRAFFVGMAPWVALAWYFWGLNLPQGPFRTWMNTGNIVEIKLNLFYPLLGMALSGLLAAGIRWWSIQLNQARSDTPPGESADGNGRPLPSRRPAELKDRQE